MGVTGIAPGDCSSVSDGVISEMHRLHIRIRLKGRRQSLTASQNLKWDLCFTMYLLWRRTQKNEGCDKLTVMPLGGVEPCKNTHANTHLSRVSQKRRNTGRSRCRLWWLSSSTVTSHFCTLGSVFASSYFRWKARTTNCRQSQTGRARQTLVTMHIPWLKA